MTLTFQTIAQLIANRTGMDADAVTAETSFRSLGLDSLHFVELGMELEETLEIEILLDDTVATIGDLIRLIESEEGKIDDQDTNL